MAQNISNTTNIKLGDIDVPTRLEKVSTIRSQYVNHQYVNFQYIDYEEKCDTISREKWNNKVEFVLSVIGYAVGLGNIWRFPYLAYKHGGGSFLLPYFIMLFSTGLPLFFMELALGQYAGQGPTKIFGKLAPAFKGLGFAMLLVAFLVSIYYNMIIAWSMYYITQSFTSVLPWSHNGTNSTNFFYTNLLGMDNETVDEAEWFGEVKWHLVACLFFAWTIICICLIKGVNSVGKVVYVTAVFPYLTLIILFGYGMTLPGAMNGLTYYVTPNNTKLLEIDVWVDAASQVFYSLGPCFGGLISVSSYNKFDNNCHRDAWVVTLVNSATSIFSGLIIFAVLGFMSNETDIEIADLIQEGPALVFIVYPEAISHMEVPQLWSVLFFLMLITLGLDSMFIMVEVMITTIMDHYREKLSGFKYLVVIITCLIGFLLGVSMCTSKGLYVFQLMDTTCATWNLIVLGVLEVILVAWIYGPNTFLNNVKDMDVTIPKGLIIYWKTCFCVLTPLTLLALIVAKFVLYQPFNVLPQPANATGVMKGLLPTGAPVAGWMITLSPLLLVIGAGFYQVWLRKKLNKPIGINMFKPTHNWKPVVERIILIEDRHLKRRTRTSFRPHLPRYSEMF